MLNAEGVVVRFGVRDWIDWTVTDQLRRVVHGRVAYQIEATTIGAPGHTVDEGRVGPGSTGGRG